MERHIQTLLNRLSYASITMATVTLILLFSQSPSQCTTGPHHPYHIPFPKSSCQSNQRQILTVQKKTQKLHSSSHWRNMVAAHIPYFQTLRSKGFVSNDSNVLCVSAGAGHEVMALMETGVDDVTGVEVIDSPPLVSRADPHDLPFFDGVFDIGFSAHLGESLFPDRFVAELERTLRIGGACILLVEMGEDVGAIRGLFQGSTFVGSENVTLVGSKFMQIIMRKKKFS
ncbi:uncharacterized protein LOC131237398 [Magnolia sinica]|uniref:uncharacterized protein LOC131237398 n=1 Tax=Magnolia sinica TaxID=86752 RepID=UPI0026584192|nr:uncharacterized protein LOC131237398 [Magnolia sinica]